MKKSQLEKIITEQIKQIKQDLSRKKLTSEPINYTGPKPTKDIGSKIGPQRADQKKFIGSDSPIELPTTYNNTSPSSPAAFYQCLYVPGPDGLGAGCYGFNQSGQWTSPVTGATLSVSSCIPWHQGGNCYIAQHQGDFPVTVNTNQGPVTIDAPPERPCAPNCIHS